MRQINPRDEQTNRSFANNPADTVNVYSLSSGVATTITVPAAAELVSFSATANFFVNFFGNAATGGANIAGNGDELNPNVRRLRSSPIQTTISIIAPTACIVSVAYYN